MLLRHGTGGQRVTDQNNAPERLCKDCGIIVEVLKDGRCDKCIKKVYELADKVGK